MLSFISTQFLVLIFFTCVSTFCSRLVFFSICFILFFNILLTIFCIFLVWERSILCPFFNRILLICINPFWNWFRLFSFFLSLPCNEFISLLICSIHAAYYLVVYLAYLYYIIHEKIWFYTGVVNFFLKIFYYKYFAVK